MATQGDYIIRQARLDDVDALVAMRLKLLDHGLRSNALLWPMPDEKRSALPDTYRQWIEGPDSYVAVAAPRETHAPIAMAVARLPRPLEFMPPRSAKIYSVWVESEHRRNGLCQRMTAYLIDWLKTRDVEKLSLEYTIGNTSAEATWQEMGFKPVYTSAIAGLEEVARAIQRKDQQ